MSLSFPDLENNSPAPTRKRQNFALLKGVSLFRKLVELLKASTIVIRLIALTNGILYNLCHIS